MVSLLKGLLGKYSLPIVVNGKLLCQGRTPVMASLANYRVSFNLMGSRTPIEQEVGDKLIKDSIKAYGEKYNGILEGSDINPWVVDAKVDPFTGAVVLETEAFKTLAREDMHEPGIQHPAAVEPLIKDFIVEYTSDYFDLYLYLFNRRIAAQYMPISVRGHFFAGLFQPLLVSTKSFKSPLLYGENSWFYELFRGHEEFLEHASDFSRKLELSCIAMCDLCDIIHTPVVFELDRKVFMLMVDLILLSNLSQEVSTALIKRHNHLFQKALYNPEQSSREDGRLLTESQQAEAVHRNNAQLFTALMDYATKMRTAIRTV